MKRNALFACALALLAGPAVFAQSSSDSSSQMQTPPEPPPAAQTQVQNAPVELRPFSRMALGAGVSPLGIGMEAVTDLNQHLNLRFTGNVFNYSTSFTASGIPATAQANFASAGVSLDVYPFHTGFRLSPGLLYLNNNRMTAVADMPAGTSITLNGTDYYSARANPVTGATPLSGNGYLNLNTTKPAFTITTGWGNHIQRNGHWSFPFEIGVAMIGKPAVNMNLSGWACTDATQAHCANIDDPANPLAVEVQTNLQAQIAKWNKDLDPLKTYPIVSAGVAYSFGIRR